jgi:hypothetical protein
MLKHTATKVKSLWDFAHADYGVMRAKSHRDFAHADYGVMRAKSHRDFTLVAIHVSVWTDGIWMVYEWYMDGI